MDNVVEIFIFEDKCIAFLERENIVTVGYGGDTK